MTWKSGFQLALVLAGIAALPLPAATQQPQPDQLFSPPPGAPPSQAEPAQAGAPKAAKSKAAPKSAPKSDPAPTDAQKDAKSKAAPKGAQKSAPAGSLVGTWAGAVAQVGHAKGYNIVVTVRAGGGDTEYPELNCTGKLTRAAGSGPYVFYLEKITRGRNDAGGRCPDGTLVIALAGDNLAFSWFATVEGQPVFAYSILTRK